MAKNKSSKLSEQPHTFRPWYFLVLAGVSAIVAVFALRSNNLNMVNLRNQVYAADKNNGNVELALKNLQDYVTHHMNTSLSSGTGSVYPPIQLQYTYGRLQAAAAKSTGSSNTALYTKAEDYCQQQIPTGFSGRYRLNCIDNYITTHGAKAQAIPTNLYEFNFLSPFWSPDLAGFSVLAVMAFVIAFAAALLGQRLIKLKR